MELKNRYEELDEKYGNVVRKNSEEIANLTNGLKLKEKQYDDLLSEKNVIEEQKKYYELKWQQKNKAPKPST